MSILYITLFILDIILCLYLSQRKFKVDLYVRDIPHRVFISNVLFLISDLFLTCLQSECQDFPITAG